MAPLRPVVRVLFDEAHSQAWSIRPEVAARMQPSHPADASYARAAALLRARRMDVAAHTDGPLAADALRDADVVVLAHPSEPKWEATTGVGSPLLDPDELEALHAFVAAGGGLVVLGESEQDKYGNNLDALLAPFGVAIAHDTVQDYERNLNSTPSWVRADIAPGARGAAGDLLAGVDEACFYRAGTLTTTNPEARVLARASASSSAPGAALALAVPHGAGRVVALADSDLFGDDCLGDLGHAALWANLVSWAAAAAYATPAPATPSPAAADPAWGRLREATDALRLLQEPDGSVDTAAHDAAGLHDLVEAMAGAVEALAPRFDHQAEGLSATVADLRAWARDGFGRPDFAASLERFRPDRVRRDGIEHLVVFPMYTQNGSRDTRFEALLVRVPWPEWLAELERDRYDNAKFVPVTLVDHTAGYDSECAVLFPETVSATGTVPNHFGGIFCDREAERFRRVVSAAADVVGLNLPPDAAALLASERLSLDSYVLWDLIHDRAHSRGDLPFDPFMIRQRMPYWMYSLEELRCDLTAFGEAVRLQGEGMAFARNVQYAILFDRIFRFPVSGTRVRNYDGLGGQLLFAYLHRHGFVHWTDNRLTVEWDRLAEGVAGLRAEVETLYREGIDRSKLAQWGAAHDLVARYVPAAAGSSWAQGARAYADVEDPRPYIDDVAPDEFPLSMFYTSLKQKLQPSLARSGAPAPAAVAA
ncbi:hypothetical protein FSW04_10700 [Baekduia soli]|uniref:DUF4350 domain-containing protein n=1 Tax=Baekduia soli TaxID=496014 RepID=A0A5B8U4X7_9ACTN|nr:DUF6421 family protein [Baekduia soli]QEC47991.1 hypothetical protein FSW04_10700 [Baekduia soli]